VLLVPNSHPTVCVGHLATSATYNKTTKQAQLEMLERLPMQLASACADGTAWLMRLKDQTTSGPKYDINTKLDSSYLQ